MKYRFPVGLLLWATTLPTLSRGQVEVFGSPEEITLSLASAENLLPGDVDGDGDLDLVAIGSRAQKLLWFEQAADGSFGGSFDVVTDLGPLQGLDVADFDGDGDVDFLVLSGDYSRVTLVLNGGPSGYEQRALLEGGVNLGKRLKFMDLDQDGDLDVFLPTRQGITFGPSGGLLVNLGAGVFAPLQSIVTGGSRVHDAAPLDVDGDGRLDLVTVGDRSRVRWFRQPPSGGAWTESLIDDTSFSRPVSVRTFDFDDDGDEDLAVAGFASDPAIFENLGGGGFGMRQPLSAGGLLGDQLAVVDVDSDGDPDLVASATQSSLLEWFENDGNLPFIGRGSLATGLGGPQRSLAVRDLDVDGFEDLLMATSRSELLVLRGAPSAPMGVAFEPTPMELTRAIPGELDTVVFDAGADGDRDLLSLSLDGSAYLSRQVGPGRFLWPEPIPIPVSAPRTLEAGDLDGDGLEELVYSDGALSIGWLQESPGAGGFSSGTIGTVASQIALPPILADFDTDGDLDVLAAETALNRVFVYEQTAPMTFEPDETLVLAPGRLSGLQVGDIDGDGLMDLVVNGFDPGGPDLRWYPGLGAGDFDPPVPVADDPLISREQLFDYESDGDLDLLWVRGSDRQIMLSVNEGGGQFVAPEELGSIDGEVLAFRVGVFDASLEHKVVLVVEPLAEGARLEVRSLLPWTPPIQTRELTPGLLGELLLDDLDLDGDLDLCARPSAQDALHWLENRRVRTVGVDYCLGAAPNSSDRVATVQAVGLREGPLETTTLRAFDLPPMSTTLFLCSRLSGFTANAGGSDGDLCLGGEVGRFARPGQFGQASLDGYWSLELALDVMPQPTGAVSALAGELWHFQAWYRDAVGGVVTSNFTTATASVLRH